MILYDATTDQELTTKTTRSNPDFPAEQGYYIFDNLDPGSYYVEFVTPDEFTATIPGSTSDIRDSDVNDTGNVGTGKSPV